MMSASKLISGMRLRRSFSFLPVWLQIHETLNQVQGDDIHLLHHIFSVMLNLIQHLMLRRQSQSSRLTRPRACLTEDVRFFDSKRRRLDALVGLVGRRCLGGFTAS